MRKLDVCVTLARKNGGKNYLSVASSGSSKWVGVKYMHTIFFRKQRFPLISHLNCI